MAAAAARADADRIAARVKREAGDRRAAIATEAAKDRKAALASKNAAAKKTEDPFTAHVAHLDEAKEKTEDHNTAHDNHFDEAAKEAEDLAKKADDHSTAQVEHLDEAAERTIADIEEELFVNRRALDELEAEHHTWPDCRRCTADEFQHMREIQDDIFMLELELRNWQQRESAKNRTRRHRNR